MDNNKQNDIQEIRKFRKFNYTLTLVEDETSETLTRQIEKAKIYCGTCQHYISIRFKDKYISFLCGCGCRIFYPSNENDVYYSTFISKEEHDHNKGNIHG